MIFGRLWEPRGSHLGAIWSKMAPETDPGATWDPQALPNDPQATPVASQGRFCIEFCTDSGNILQYHASQYLGMALSVWVCCKIMLLST